MDARKSVSGALAALICIMVVFSPAAAQDDSTGRTSRPSASFKHETLGIGVIFGEPTGLSGKMWTTKNTGFDLGLAWSFSGDGHFHIHGDYLFHNFGLFDVDKGALPVYVGIGGRIRFEDDTRVGVRFPVGLEYFFQDWPLAVFAEIVPILDLAPSTKGDVNGGMGVRFYF